LSLKFADLESVMTEHDLNAAAVDRFILEQIDSVPHLETLLLLWTNRPDPYTVEELANRLYVSSGVADRILQDLTRQGLIASLSRPPVQYRYEPDPEGRDRLIELVDLTYRRELVRISTMIHSKPSRAVHEFARAFRFTKERD